MDLPELVAPPTITPEQEAAFWAEVDAEIETHLAEDMARVVVPLGPAEVDEIRQIARQLTRDQVIIPTYAMHLGPSWAAAQPEVDEHVKILVWDAIVEWRQQRGGTEAELYPGGVKPPPVQPALPKEEPPRRKRKKRRKPRRSSRPPICGRVQGRTGMDLLVHLDRVQGRKTKTAVFHV